MPFIDATKAINGVCIQLSNDGRKEAVQVLIEDLKCRRINVCIVGNGWNLNRLGEAGGDVVIQREVGRRVDFDLLGAEFYRIVRQYRHQYQYGKEDEGEE